jgi:signal transduction histidine kinase
MEELPGSDEDRLLIRYFLGLPLKTHSQVLGVLVFIRFGSPPYTADQEYLAQFISEHITHLVEREDLIGKIANLEAERKLAQLQDDFIATVSHDLRSPLGFIKGYATTLLREDANWDVATRREFLSVIDEEADRLSDLIDNLLDSSRLQAGTLRMDFQSVRLDSLLMEIVQRAEVAGYDIKIQLRILAPSVRINADPTRMVQIFDNLLSNASKYASGSEVEIGYQIEGQHVHITIRDQGEGISEEHLDNIFKRFYRIQNTDSSGRGSGLGLYICRQIINSHRGEIYATSKPGEGTTFHILLPIER